MPPEPKDGPAAPEPGNLDDRVAALETGQDGIRDTLSEVLGILKGGGAEPASGDPEPAQGPSGNIADEIRRQIAEVRAEEKTEADQRTLAERLGAVETSLTEMRERPPGPLPRRSTRAMWGRE